MREMQNNNASVKCIRVRELSSSRSPFGEREWSSSSSSASQRALFLCFLFLRPKRAKFRFVVVVVEEEEEEKARREQRAREKKKKEETRTAKTHLDAFARPVVRRTGGGGSLVHFFAIRAKLCEGHFF